MKRKYLVLINLIMGPGLEKPGRANKGKKVPSLKPHWLVIWRLSITLLAIHVAGLVMII